MMCCVCLMESPQILGIFDEEGRCLNIAGTLEKHFWFKTHPSDLLTSHICTICWGKIEDFHQFYENVERIHQSFGKYQQQTYIKEEEITNVKQEDKPEENIFENNDTEFVIDIKTNTDNQEEGGTTEINPLENGELQCNNNNLKELDSECSSTSEEDEPSDDSETENLFTDEKKANNIEKKKLKGITKRKCLKNSEKNSDEPKNKRSFHRLDPKLTEQLIRKHIPMLCDLCVFSGHTFSDIVGHFREHHTKEQPYIMCCNRKFTRSYCIDQHAIIHENPDSFRCDKCNRSFTTTYGLQTHNLNHHAPEEKRIHACDFCPRRFGRRQLLEIHRQTHIPKEDWTITCAKCTTRSVKFVSQYLLNIHNSMFHRRVANICHVCAKEIKDKKAFEKHVRAHFEDSGPRVKCTFPNCGRWLKDEDNLKTHMQLHNLAGKTYKCPECNKECPNRRALTNHKRYVHSNPTFRCEQCDKTFKKAISLREHMTQHTGETLYSCPFCIRTFNSNANMHAHKKKQHPVEWKELRRKNIGPLPE